MPMPLVHVTVEMTETARDHGAVALIVPLGIDTEFQRLEQVDLPKDWGTTILSEARTGQLAAVLTPPHPDARALVRHVLSDRPGTLPDTAWHPEPTARRRAAADLAQDARRIAETAGGGRRGLEAIVLDTAERFTYGAIEGPDRWYTGHDSIPAVACAVGDCIDINTYLVAALRTAGYETAYLTCYFFDDDPAGIAAGMHCWVRTRHDGTVEDWDIAHFKKAGRNDVHAALNPVPGLRVTLAHGRDHVYRWNDLDIHLPIPSRPNWVKADGGTVWGAPPVVMLKRD
jgi:transglutaminase-like putative cysteine protease